MACFEAPLQPGGHFITTKYDHFSSDKVIISDLCSVLWDQTDTRMKLWYECWVLRHSVHGQTQRDLQVFMLYFLLWLKVCKSRAASVIGWDESSCVCRDGNK